MTIKIISLSGTPQEIGLQHGELLADEVHHNIDFYRSLFLRSRGNENQILRAAEQFLESIRAYHPDFVIEIDHIAKGASVSEPLWLYALNARTELSMMNGVQECTAIVCPKNNLLGQTWDWAKKLEGKFFLMNISFPDGRKILQLCEAGMIGKIGLNNYGLGVTLNYLYDEFIDFSTVPIHILLRKVLECRTLKEAREAACKSGVGKASNLIIASSGKAVDIEFAGEIINVYDIEEDVYVHTNHYLHAKPPNIVNEESFLNSVSRCNTAKEKFQVSSNYDARQLIEGLSDQTNGRNTILAAYKPDPQEMLGEYGTLATIVMDLRTRRMLVRYGNPKNRGFAVDEFDEYTCQ